jgi:UMF1 family MFS transporter
MKFSKTHHYWALYSWSKSVYSLVISTAIFPLYYKDITSSIQESIYFHGPEWSDMVVYSYNKTASFLGFEWRNTVIYSYTIATSYLLISILSPFLGSLADSYGRRKSLLMLFLLIGSSSTSLLYFLTPENVELGLILSFTASVGFAGSYIFYNSYLPVIAEKSMHDKLSGYGFAMGYFGSALLMIFCSIMILFPVNFGLENEFMAMRTAFLITGMWWMVFGFWSVFQLPKDRPKPIPSLKASIVTPFSGLRTVWLELKSDKSLSVFLSSFFWYSTGMQTIILLASIFGAKVLGLEYNQLITSILIIQFVAILGVYVFTKLGARIGTIQSITVGVGIWMGICLAAYFVQSAIQFYIIAALVGLVLGAVQSLSRSTFSKMVADKGKNSTYFSFYDVIEKIATTIGMFSIGILEAITGDLRNAAIALTLFFAVGLIQIFRVIRIQKKSPSNAY